MEAIKNDENAKVFIIDDEADTCFLISVILNQKNISSASVSTLAEARTALVANNTPLLIFLDNQLPDGWGVDFIDFIRDNSPLSKIILYSAFATPEMRNDALTKGADFMNKPLTKSALETAVDSFIKH